MATFWKALTIRSKLFVGIGAILATFALTSAVVLWVINGLNAEASLAFDHIIPTRTQADQAQYDLLDADDMASSYVMDRVAANWPAELHTYESDLAAVKNALPALQNAAGSASERDNLSAFEQWLETYTTASEHVFAVKRAGKYDEAIRLSGTVDTSKGQRLFGDFVKSVDGRAKIAIGNVQAATHEATTVCWIGSSVAVLLGALIALILSAELTGRLRDVTKKIRTASEVVGNSAREIAAGNADLSRRTEEQAASLEETAASMEQMAATVNQNGANTRAANELATGASTIALKGGRVVSEVVDTMEAINTSARKIVDIISVIDGIAFQTNILALNAAVEAARAGEQGRGFAVVAGEVRTLAQRSAAAAKEIKTLIGDSVEKTAAGTRLVDEAGGTMSEIVEAVKRVTDIISLIAGASTEQSDGIGQINQAIVQMDQVTQQNAALVEEMSASADLLHDHATSLIGAVTELAVMQHRGATPPDAASPAALTPNAPLQRKTERTSQPVRPARTAPRAGEPVAAKAAARTGLPATRTQTTDDQSWDSF